MMTSRSINFGLGLALALLVLNTVASYRNTLQIVENEQAVSHTHQVLAELTKTLSTINDAETGQRGYLLTGKDRYLEPYLAAIARINWKVSSLRRLTSDNFQQQQQVQQLEQSIASKLAELQYTIDLRRTGQVKTAMQVVKTDRGKQLMDRIRQQIAAMDSSENQLLQQRATESESSVNGSLLTFTLASVIDLLLLGLVYFLIRRSEGQRKQEAESQKQLLRQIEKSEEKFRQIAENIQEVFWISEPQSQKTIYVSPSYETIWGRKLEEVYTNFQAWSKAICAEDRDRVQRAYRENAIRGTYDEEYRIVRPDGSIRWIRDRGFPVRSSNEVRRVVGVAEDISEQKFTEAKIRELNANLERRVEERTSRLQELTEEMEAFTYSVSHDLRAPLRTMQGFAQALLEDYGNQLDETGKEYIHYVTSGAQEMETLIADLLAYSRLKRVEILLEPVDLTLVVEDALKQLNAQLQEQQARITVETPLPPVMAHRSTLVQAIVNLIGNAVKFLESGVQPQVKIWAEEVISAKDLNTKVLRLWIVDNGIGIAPEHQERIFRIFERLHGVETYAGTGVGLAIVRKGLERMNGRAGVESQLGQGSRFWIELPAVRTRD